MPAAALAHSPADPAPADGGTRRPRLLVTAARHGMEHYSRQRDLPRLIGACPPGEGVIARLVEMEMQLDAARRMGDPAWSCLRHVEVLIALLAERAMRQE